MRRGGLVGVLLWLAIAGAPAAAGAQDALTSLRGLLVDADVEDGATDVSVLKTPLASLLEYEASEYRPRAGVIQDSQRFELLPALGGRLLGFESSSHTRADCTGKRVDLGSDVELALLDVPLIGSLLSVRRGSGSTCVELLRVLSLGSGCP